MPASIRATTTVEGNVVTLNVAAMTASPPPPPPPPFRVELTRRGTTVTIRKGKIDVTIEIPADAAKPVVVDARGNAVCRGPAAPATAKKAPAARKRATRRGTRATAAMTPPPPPDDK